MDYSNGYYSKDISLGQSDYVKNLYIILNLEEEPDVDESSNNGFYLTSLILCLFYVIN